MGEGAGAALGVAEGRGGVHGIRLSRIAARTKGIWAVRPMDLLLTPREIRDVVEFLANER